MLAASISAAGSELNIKGDEHGIKRGWFSWPSNYDPVWLLNCDGFEQRDVQPEPQHESATSEQATASSDGI